jgi:hypothetical protein
MGRTSSVTIPAAHELNQQRFPNGSLKKSQTNMDTNDESEATNQALKSPIPSTGLAKETTDQKDDNNPIKQDDEDDDEEANDNNDAEDDDDDDDDDDEDLLGDFQLYDYDQEEYDVDDTLVNRFNPENINLNCFVDSPGRYANPSINEFEQKLRNPICLRDDLKEISENFMRFIQDHVNKDTHKEDWLLKCETFFMSTPSDHQQITNILAYVKLKQHAKFNTLVNVLIDWSIECIDLYSDVYNHGSKYLTKKFNSYKLFKLGVDLCVLLASGIDETTCELFLSKYQLQSKILNFFDDKYVHTPIKLLLLKLLDSSLYFSFGINTFLGKLMSQ